MLADYSVPLLDDIRALALAFSALRDAVSADDLRALDSALARIEAITTAARVKIALHTTTHTND